MPKHPAWKATRYACWMPDGMGCHGLRPRRDEDARYL